MTDLTCLTSRFQNFDQKIWSETSRFFPALQKYVFPIKQLLKACYKLCIIYMIISPDPDTEICDSSEGDWGFRSIYSIFCQKLLTLLVKGGGGGHKV